MLKNGPTEMKFLSVAVPKHKDTIILDEQNWISNLTVRSFPDLKPKTKRIKAVPKAVNHLQELTSKPRYNRQGHR